MSFAKASMPTWRARGKFDWTFSVLTFQSVSVFLGDGILKCNWKSNLQGNHSLLVMIFRVSPTDWLLIRKHSISMFNYTQKLVLWGRVHIHQVEKHMNALTFLPFGSLYLASESGDSIGDPDPPSASHWHVTESPGFLSCSWERVKAVCFRA